MIQNYFLNVREFSRIKSVSTGAKNLKTSVLYFAVVVVVASLVVAVPAVDVAAHVRWSRQSFVLENGSVRHFDSYIFNEREVKKRAKEHLENDHFILSHLIYTPNLP